MATQGLNFLQQSLFSPKIIQQGTVMNLHRPSFVEIHSIKFHRYLANGTDITKLIVTFCSSCVKGT